ncbi:MAG: bacteriophytochrome (light-regulated signal transduction histidine kinase) [Candidatus Solibacter sp.]|jgi:signal transduction histidine kinase|nr:bacteriophytochrome (light-regulated signal transduction histidine kinase) [Candidatus Solibacter sp.]
MGPARILNVDDYGPGRYARSKMLRQFGFEVQEAANGTEALLKVANKPDVVLLDINMPDLDGLEVCRRIKGNPATSNIIVLHLSASKVNSIDRVIGLNNGADSYLTEPIEPEVLAATVRALIRARRAEDALRRSNQDLRELTHLLSHDLREPLRAITVYAELLDKSFGGRLNAAERQYLDFTLSGARHMNEVIEGVLVFSRTMHEGFVAVDVPAGDALRAACSELELSLKESGAQVSVGSLPVVRANMAALTRVFSNLLSNSVKYAGDAAPRISITAEAVGGSCKFTVRDHGIGIEPEYHRAIFEPFKRLHGKEIAGVGIGLSLCRRLIEAQGGQMWVESEAGQGSSFFFTLPQAGPDERAGGPTDLASRRSAQ